MKTRTDGPADPRLYVRMSIDLPLNPKIARMGNPAAAWTYAASLCYAASIFSDGHVPVDAVLRVAGTPKPVVRALVKAGLWHLPGHDCDRCEQPVAGDAIVHDYLQHQRSAAEVQGLSDKRRAAGKAGAAKRWSGEANGKPIANAMAIAIEPLWPEDSGSSSISPSGSSSTSSEIGNGKVTGENEAAIKSFVDDSITPDKIETDKGSSGVISQLEIHSTCHEVSMASAMANAWQTDSKPIADRDIEQKSKSKTSPSSTSTDPEGWEDFWSAFPRKDGKTDAKAAYVKAIKKPGITPELLTEAATSYAKRMRLDRTERAKIKMGQGWLNSQRWEDETTQAATTSDSIGWWQR